MTAAKKIKTYTVADYMSWDDNNRSELIEGIYYDMSPAPRLSHQSLSRHIFDSFSDVLRQNKAKCELFAAPTDVVLSELTVVQPDILIVCDKKKTENGKYINGAPDLIVEILSPSTSLKDKREKRILYEKHGVSEYLIIDETEKILEYFVLNKSGKYELPQIFGSNEKVSLKLFKKHIFELKKWFVS